LTYDVVRWFCHVDDDTYVNVVALVKLLRQYPHFEDWYVGKSSLRRPMTLKLGGTQVMIAGSLPVN